MLAALSASVFAHAETYDVLIRNGRVLDGTGNPWFGADIAVRDGRIVALGRLADDAEATTVIDADGLYVTPGFIDVHSHAAAGLARAELKHAAPLLAQGDHHGRAEPGRRPDLGRCPNSARFTKRAASASTRRSWWGTALCAAKSWALKIDRRAMTSSSV